MLRSFGEVIGTAVAMLVASILAAVPVAGIAYLWAAYFQHDLPDPNNVVKYAVFVGGIALVMWTRRQR